MSNRRNPWLEDENNSSTSNNNTNFDPNRDYLQEHVQKQQDTLASQQRAMRVLAETEQIGADTAVELSRQGEVLTRAETKVDNINENLNTAEHHIRTIKSWWGGFTNKYRKQPQTKQPVEKVEGTPENTEKFKNKIVKFCFRSNFIILIFLILCCTSESAHAAVSQQISQIPSPKMTSQTKPASGQMHQYDLYENQIDTNLDQMSAGLGRLKNMGLNLNTELETQDKQIGRLNKKMAKVDERTSNVNSVLRGLNK